MPPAAKQRSNIRTRSHPQPPAIPVDLTASPFKLIRRQNQIATQSENASTTSTFPEPPIEQELLVSHRKRSSPSSSREDETKRQRVSVEREEKEVAASCSPFEPPPSDVASVFEIQKASENSLTNNPTHVDLTRLPRSPVKAASSPFKLFKITTHTGGALEVPVTPARKSTVNSKELIETEIISPSRVKIPVTSYQSSQIPPHPSSCTKQVSDANTVLDPTEDSARASASSPPEPVLENSTHQTGPLPEPPATPKPTTVKNREHVAQFKTPLKCRGTIIAGPSRLPQPASAFKTPFTPGVLAGTISSLAKIKAPVSPMRLRSRSQLKVKFGIKDKTPTRLAFKRTIRRNSLNKEKIKGAATLPANSSGPLANAAGKPTKGGTQTSLTGFFKQRSVISRDPSNLNSPSKPTPLAALSTALKKLEMTAPLPPSCPAMDDRPSQITAQKVNTTHSQNSEADVPGQNTAATENTNATPKARLPMRLPSNLDINGRAPDVQSDSLTNRNPSPIRSSDPNVELKQPPTSKLPEVFDVDDNTCEAVEQKENKRPLEFFVPLVDESSATKNLQALVQISPSRRASQASLALSQSLSAPNRPSIFPNARSVSTSHLQLNPRSPVKTRGKTKPSLPSSIEAANQTNGKRLNARMPGSLDVLKDCVIYADVRTEEGEDAAPLFVDMLRGLGARILSKPSKSCTHLVFKAGVPSTVIKYKLLPEPKPLVVSIGWVVECVEKRSHVEENKFLVNLDDIDIVGGSQRRRSMTMQPKQIRALISGPRDPADNSMSGETSFSSEDSSATGSGLLANLSPPRRATIAESLPPLERARQRSQRFPRLT